MGRSTGESREILTGHGRTVLGQRLIALRRELAAASRSHQTASDPACSPQGDAEELRSLIALTVELNQLEALLELVEHPELELGRSIGPGAVIEVIDAGSGASERYRLVGGQTDSGSLEVDVGSPLGQALLGRRLGSLVTLHSPDGLRIVQVISTTATDATGHPHSVKTRR